MKSDLKVVTDETVCVGCITCALFCSFTYQKKFNPLEACIRIKMNYDSKNEITFTEDCNNCGICVRHCPYGALKILKEET